MNDLSQKIMRFSQVVVIGFSLYSVSACMQSQSLVAGDKMPQDAPFYEQSLGAQRDEVVAAADDHWQVQSECALEKTGVGANRRAYFLERCTYTNPKQVTVCGLSPILVEYAFLEKALVQVKYQFTESDEAAFGACVQEQALSSGFTVTNEIVPDSEAEGRVRLIAADKKTAISVGENREVRVFDSEVVPTVHALRGKL